MVHWLILDVCGSQQRCTSAWGRSGVSLWEIRCWVSCDKSHSMDCVDRLKAISREALMVLILTALVFAWRDLATTKRVLRHTSSEYRVVETPRVSRKGVREAPDISENWVEECGKFKTGEEKESGFFEERGTGVLTCLGGEWRIFWHFWAVAEKRTQLCG